MRDARYLESYGIWKVTTQGDCEGRTTKDLGIYEGFVDDIAFRLGSKSYYSLCFTAAEPLPAPEAVKAVTSVNVILDIQSGTWPNDMTPNQRVEFFQKFFEGRVYVQPGQHYASVTIYKSANDAQAEARRRALGKLNADDRKALGLPEAD